MAQPEPLSPSHNPDDASLSRSQDDPASLKALMESQQFQLADQVNTIARLNSELQAIHHSNSWALMQFLGRVRRFFVPEHSRRERILRAMIQLLRNPRKQQVIPFLREMKHALFDRRAFNHRAAAPTAAASSTASALVSQTSIPDQTTQPVQRSTLSGAFFRLPDTFPWPLVSVILPVYNHADLLEQSARSVLYGTYHNLELIILDDGSTDDIEPVLKRLLVNPRVRVYRQPNQKLPRTLTHAHQVAQGEFITWTSSDNLMAPQAIEQMVSALLTNPEAVMVYADVSVIDDDGNLLTDGSYRPQNLDPLQPGVVRLHRDTRPLGYEADNYINACFVYRREAALALEGHYADDLRGLEDYDFWLRMQRCGHLQHLGNAEPLYQYRVHQRTMSHELLTQQLRAHLDRRQKLLAYEEQRRNFGDRRWSIALDEQLQLQDRQWIATTIEHLPINLLPEPAGWDASQKQMRIVPPEVRTDDPLYIRSLPDTWELDWRSPWSGEAKKLPAWKGMEINPLALKTRELNKNPWEVPQAGKHPLIGCHVGLAGLEVDIQATRCIISRNDWAFFVFIDIPGQDNRRRGQEITDGLENALYLEPRELGTPYSLYASLDLLWLPPLAFAEYAAYPPRLHPAYRSLLALAYAIRRPMLVPDGIGPLPAPYQARYYPTDETLLFARQLERRGMDIALLNRYLEAWTPAGCFSQLLRYADAASQEIALPRPDYGQPVPPITTPQPWIYTRPEQETPLKVVLGVDSLDKGGLEEVVASLAQGLPQSEIDPVVLVGKSGGLITERLKSAGIRVYVADGQAARVRQVLQQEKPDLLNAHWFSLEYMAQANELGIPILETIHNTYAFLTPEMWQTEIQRSRYFNRVIAVSQLARQYYTHWSSVIDRRAITVVPNGIDTQRLAVTDYTTARHQLGFTKDEFFFVVLASYAVRKNQLGLVTAFDQVAQRYPQARLICAGNVVDTSYILELAAYKDSLKSHGKITLDKFRQDTGLLLSAADALVINSFFEGWSIAATEALLAGTPLIHADVGSARELVGEQGERGILVPNPACDPLDMNASLFVEQMWQRSHRNTGELVQAMSTMIEQRQRWQVERPYIRAYAQENFNLERMIQRYVKIYHQVAAMPPGAST